MKLSLRYRVLSSIIGGALLVMFLYLRGNFIIIPGTIIALIGVVEFNQAFKKAGFKPMTVISIVLSILAIITFIFYSTHNFKVVIIVGLLFFMFMLSYHVISDHQIIDIMITLFSIVYVVFPIMLIMLLSKRNDMYLWLVFILAISSDVFAFLVGRTLGKTKLIEKVSPKKTVEGAVGGLLGCIVATVITKLLFLPNTTLTAAILLAIIGSTASQIGDLTASKIKRYCNIKDFGKLIPGHGGVLDRFDSILFTATLVFMYVWMFIEK